MPGGGNPSRHREGAREMARAEHQFLGRLAEHHAQEGQPCRRRRAQGRRRQVRQVLHARSGQRRLALKSDGQCRNFFQRSAAVAMFEDFQQGKAMRRFACLAFAACCLTSAAFAQSSPTGALPSPEDIAKKNSLTVGVAAAIVPDYEGSDDYRVIPAGAVRGKVSGISFSTHGTYLYVDVVPQSGKFGFDAGPIIGLRFDNRRRTDDAVVRLMPKRKTAIEAGGFVGVSFRGLTNPYDTLALHLDVLHDIGSAHKSTVFSPNLDFSTPLSLRTYASVSVGAEFVSKRFA